MFLELFLFIVFSSFFVSFILQCISKFQNSFSNETDYFTIKIKLFSFVFMYNLPEQSCVQQNVIFMRKDFTKLKLFYEKIYKQKYTYTQYKMCAKYW